MIWAVLTLWLASLVVFLFVLRVFVTEQRAQRGTHAKCIAHVASVTSNHFVATSLRELAERFESVEGIGELNRIRNVVWKQGGPSVLVLWMREQADRIEAGQ